MKKVKIIPIKLLEEEQTGISFRRKLKSKKVKKFKHKFNAEISYPEFLEIDKKGLCVREENLSETGHIMLHRYKNKYYLSEGMFDEPDEPDEWIYTRYVGDEFHKAYEEFKKAFI